MLAFRSVCLTRCACTWEYFFAYEGYVALQLTKQTSKGLRCSQCLKFCCQQQVYYLAWNVENLIGLHWRIALFVSFFLPPWIFCVWTCWRRGTHSCILKSIQNILQPVSLASLTLSISKPSAHFSCPREVCNMLSKHMRALAGWICTKRLYYHCSACVNCLQEQYKMRQKCCDSEII